MDEIIKAISGDKFVSISVISAREMVERARRIHDSSPVATAAVGRMLSAAAIIGSDMKKPDASLTARINGGGPLGTIMVVTDYSGNARCYVQNTKVDLPKNTQGKLDVSGAVGKAGSLTVIRDLRGKMPYIGTTNLVSGGIAEDFAAYLSQSEQIRAACALGVHVARDRSVVAAGGFIARLLPGAPDHIIGALEKNTARIGAVTGFLKKEAGADLLLGSVMDGFSPRIIGRGSVEYKCTCSRSRFLDALLSLDKSERDDIKSKAEPIEIKCQFCEAVHVFEVDEIS